MPPVPPFVALVPPSPALPASAISSQWPILFAPKTQFPPKQCLSSSQTAPGYNMSEPQTPAGVKADAPASPVVRMCRQIPRTH